MKTCSAFTRLVAGWSVLNGGLCFIPRTLTTGGGVHIRQSTTVDKVPSLDQGQVLRAATGSWFDQLFAKPAKAINGGKGSEVVKLKQQLLDVTQSTRRGIATSDEQREEIDGLIAALEPLNPNADSVNDSLSALWILKWTTEREIIFLMDKGLLGLPSGPVQQTIDVGASTLSNTMLFGSDSSFEVASSIDPEESGPRVNFKFEACKLRYRGLTVPLPPVGKGWFESVYLDEDFRVTRDVRGDVTVLVKGQEQ